MYEKVSALFMKTTVNVYKEGRESLWRILTLFIELESWNIPRRGHTNYLES